MDIKKFNTSKYINGLEKVKNIINLKKKIPYQNEIIEKKILNLIEYCGPFLKEFNFGGIWLKLTYPIMQKVR